VFSPQQFLYFLKYPIPGLEQNTKFPPVESQRNNWL